MSTLHASEVYATDERKKAPIPETSVFDHMMSANFSVETTAFRATPHIHENSDIDGTWLHSQADDKHDVMCKHSDCSFLSGESAQRQSMQQPPSSLDQALSDEVPRAVVIEQGQAQFIDSQTQTADATEPKSSKGFSREGWLWFHSQGPSANSNYQGFWDAQDLEQDCLRAVDSWRRSRMNASMNLSSGELFAEQACHVFQLDHFIHADM